MFSRLPNYLNLSDNRRNAVKIQLVYSKHARVNHGKSATESRLFRKLEFPIKTYRIISGKSGLFVQSGFPLELYLPRFVTSPQLLRARPTGTHPFRANTLCLANQPYSGLLFCSSGLGFRIIAAPRGLPPQCASVVQKLPRSTERGREIRLSCFSITRFTCGGGGLPDRPEPAGSA